MTKRKPGTPHKGWKAAARKRHQEVPLPCPFCGKEMVPFHYPTKKGPSKRTYWSHPDKPENCSGHNCGFGLFTQSDIRAWNRRADCPNQKDLAYEHG